MMRVSRLLCLLTLLVLATTATAATRTVEPGGNLRGVIDQSGPGDTVLVRAGTYNCGNCLDNIRGGTSGARLTIAGAPQDGARKAIIKIGSGGGSNGLTLSNGDSSYITWDNLVFDASNAGSSGIKITGSAHHNRFSNGEIFGAENS